MDDLPLVEVLWRDAEEYGEVGWNDIEEIKEYAKSPCPLVRSIGYVLHNSESHISLIRAYHSEGFSTVEKIPKGFIEAIRGLERL
jgi:hypothetical protein